MSVNGITSNADSTSYSYFFVVDSGSYASLLLPGVDLSSSGFDSESIFGNSFYSQCLIKVHMQPIRADADFDLTTKFHEFLFFGNTNS